MQEPDPRPGYYYVSAIDGQRVAKVRGPFARHADALAAVEAARERAYELAPYTWFYMFGIDTLKAAIKEAKRLVITQINLSTDANRAALVAAFVACDVFVDSLRANLDHVKHAPAVALVEITDPDVITRATCAALEATSKRLVIAEADLTNARADLAAANARLRERVEIRVSTAAGVPSGSIKPSLVDELREPGAAGKARAEHAARQPIPLAPDPSPGAPIGLVVPDMSKPPASPTAVGDFQLQIRALASRAAAQQNVAIDRAVAALIVDHGVRVTDMELHRRPLSAGGYSMSIRCAGVLRYQHDQWTRSDVREHKGTNPQHVITIESTEQWYDREGKPCEEGAPNPRESERRCNSRSGGCGLAGACDGIGTAQYPCPHRASALGEQYPPPPRCESHSAIGGVRCALRADHKGQHENTGITWQTPGEQYPPPPPDGVDIASLRFDHLQRKWVRK